MKEAIAIILNFLAEHPEYQNGKFEFIYNTGFAELVRIHEHREEE